MAKTLEERISYLEDREALRDLLTRYCTAVDSLGDVQDLVDCFTEDAVMDLSPIGLERLEGHSAIKTFFTQVFDDMTHHAHFNTNFVLTSVSGDIASATAYVNGMGASKAGANIDVYVKYFLEMRRIDSEWKLTSFTESFMLPAGDEVTAVHIHN